RPDLLRKEAGKNLGPNLGPATAILGDDLRRVETEKGGRPQDATVEAATVSATISGEKEERPLPDSNRGWRICNPLPGIRNYRRRKPVRARPNARGAHSGAEPRPGPFLVRRFLPIWPAWWRGRLAGQLTLTVAVAALDVLHDNDRLQYDVLFRVSSPTWA